MGAPLGFPDTPPAAAAPARGMSGPPSGPGTIRPPPAPGAPTNPAASTPVPPAPGTGLPAAVSSTALAAPGRAAKREGPRDDGPALFISYARPDADAVGNLAKDLGLVSRDVWFDQELRSQGGQEWWNVILAKVRAAEVFVFVLSPDSVRSNACRSELSYALDLGLPILPVKVRDTNIQLAPEAIVRTQVVSYERRSAETATALVVAVLQKRTETRPPPDPLPTPPPAPIIDLEPVRQRLAAPHLSFDEQAAVLVDLRVQARNPDQAEATRSLAEQFLAREDLTVSAKKDLEALILKLPVSTMRDPADTRRRRTLSELDPDTVDMLRKLLPHIRNSHFTPIIGRGMTNSLLGPLRRLAPEWARDFRSPTQLRRRTDLPVAAQFVEVMNNVDTLRNALIHDLRDRIVATNGAQNGGETPGDLNRLVSDAWRRRRADVDYDPYQVLAGLPCRIYVTANPWTLMAEALRDAGKEPEAEICPWRPDVYDWPESVFERDPDYEPSVEHPLVYHVFGTVEVPDSLVLSADDYLDFLIGVTADRLLIPKPVASSLADSALLLLGFSLEEMDIRVLLRGLIRQEGGSKRSRYSHVGAQSDFRPGQDGPTREQRYLERYFGKYCDPSIDIFWGTVDEFAAGLAELIGPAP